MLTLPTNPSLPIHLLAGSFNNTSATYKFYWFLALLEEIEMGNTTINKQHLFARMVASAWYTVNYFHISFGKQDQLQRAIEELLQIEGISIDEKRSKIVEQLKHSGHKRTYQILRYFDGEVPYRFLSPWFPKLKGDKPSIYKYSQSFENDCIYGVNEQEVSINPKWLAYLQHHAGILKSFCYWNLSLYLQKHNPNVPDIPNKLIKPALRGSLNKQRKFFWDVVLDHSPSLSCIYTQATLTKGNYVVEHFIPYAFVSHDLVWNLIPADKRFNSSKSDKLPPLDIYFEPYFQLQKHGLLTIERLDSRNKLLEDYLPILPNLAELKAISEDSLKERFKETIQPLITIAANNGFEYF